MNIAYKIIGGFAKYKGDMDVLRLCHEAGFVFKELRDMDKLAIVDLPQVKH